MPGRRDRSNHGRSTVGLRLGRDDRHLHTSDCPGLEQAVARLVLWCGFGFQLGDVIIDRGQNHETPSSDPHADTWRYSLS
jgi:hypothetical protein